MKKRLKNKYENKPLDLRNILLLVLLGLAAYFNTFSNQFLWDDDFLIVNNYSVQSWSNWWQYFVTDLYNSASNYYRPMQMISYNLDYSLWKLEPFGYHLSNLVFHLFVTILLYFFVKRLTKDNRVAFVASAIFIVHPLNIESVTYISGRADSIMGIFLLLSILFFDSHFVKEKRKAILYLGASAISFLLALFSKESAVIFPIIIFVYAWFFKTKDEISRSEKMVGFKFVYPFLVISAVYLILRTSALNFRKEEFIGHGYNFYLGLLTGLKAITGYIDLFFFPIKLFMERSIPFATTFFETGIIFSFLVVLFLIFLIFRLFNHFKVISFGLLWFLVSLIPVSGVLPLKANMSEHWMYIAIMGFLIALSSLVVKFADKSKLKRRIIFSLVVIFIILITARTVVRNDDWRDKETFYIKTLEYNPNSISILNNLANIYTSRKDYILAESMYKRALLNDPKSYLTYFNLASLYSKMDRIDDAFIQLKKCIVINPDYSKGYYNLGLLYEKIKDTDLAVNSYKVAIEKNPYYFEAYNNLGNLYFDMGDLNESETNYLKAVLFNQNVAGIYNNLGNIYIRTSKPEPAIKMYLKAIGIKDDNPDFYLNLGVAYGSINDQQNAQACFMKALSIKPDFIDARINLGVSYYIVGKRRDASREWDRVLFLDPGNKIARDYFEKGLNLR